MNRPKATGAPAGPAATGAPAGPAATGEAHVDLVASLRPQVAARLSTGTSRAQGQAWEHAVGRAVGVVLEARAHQALAAGQAPLSIPTEARVRRALIDSFVGAGGLQALLDEPDIETVNINGADNVWVHYHDGSRAQAEPVAGSDAELVALLRELGARQGAHERRFSADRPELSMQLPGGARLHALQLVTDRVAVSIRRHRLLNVSLDDLVELGELTVGLRDLFTAMVAARRNIVISGGPAAGKTTFLRALANTIPTGERLITVEDSYELSLDRAAHPNLVAMQARESNLEGAGEFSLDACVRASLRLAPDRVIVGEVRGAEVVTMAKAMSIGIDGSLATVHASSSRQAFLRLVTYAMEPPALYPREAATSLIAGAVHVVVHIDRTAEGARVVSSIREVVGEDGGQIVSNEVYRPGPDRRAVPATRLRDETLDQLQAAGLDPAMLEHDRWWRP
jgi:Flp pilus assembly CpaF family ATPase